MEVAKSTPSIAALKEATTRKIMKIDFEVLINDSFLSLLPTSDLSPAHNKWVLSLLNDYEDKSWRHDKFESFVWDNIALTALTAQERDRLANRSHSTLKASAQNLRLTEGGDDIGEGSELAEIVLYGIMKHHYGALPIVPKIFYKQNARDNAKGADSVHIVIANNDFTLWFGEAKFYNSIEDARLPKIVTSVKTSLLTEKLKKENSIITNMQDLRLLIEDKALLEKILTALSRGSSIDNIKNRINIPILLLHECSITAGSYEMDDSYRQKVRDFHLDRARKYFKKQIHALASDVNKYGEIRFHIILFPVPERAAIIESFTKEIRHYAR